MICQFSLIRWLSINFHIMLLYRSIIIATETSLIERKQWNNNCFFTDEVDFLYK